MKAYDFEYDGVRLSDRGFIICKFDSSGVETVSNGSEITFNTVPTLNGIKHELTSSTYDDCLEATFQICKNLCDTTDEEISLDDMRDIMRWLNRKGFHKFKLIDDEYSGIYFEASFNVSKIEINGRICGFELEMFTNMPFAIQEPVTIVINNEENAIVVDNKEDYVVRSFFSKSDEEGYIYPDMEIVISKDGNFKMDSITEDRTMEIRNCSSGEVIKIDYPIIESSLGDSRSTKIQNDFNWIFFRVATSFKNRENEFTTSLPCTIKMTYSPIVKVGV